MSARVASIATICPGRIAGNDAVPDTVRHGSNQVIFETYEYSPDFLLAIDRAPVVVVASCPLVAGVPDLTSPACTRFDQPANIGDGTKDELAVSVTLPLQKLGWKGAELRDSLETGDVFAAQRAIDEGATRYTATEGIPPLREAIAAHANALYRGEGSIVPGEVVVSTGSKQSLFNACFVLFGAGDEVLVPTPSWPSYDQILRLARATPVPVAGDPERGLRITVGAAREAATPRTRGLILGSPGNPTGWMLTADELSS